MGGGDGVQARVIVKGAALVFLFAFDNARFSFQQPSLSMEPFAEKEKGIAPRTSQCFQTDTETF